MSFASVPDALSHWARTRPDTVAYTFAGADLAVRHRVTYRQLEQAALTVAADLGRRTRPGDRVLLLLPPGFDYLAAFLGCLHAGVVAVPLYAPRPGAKLERIEAVVRSCHPALALTTEELATDVRAAIPSHTVTAALAGAPSPARPAAPDGDATAFLQYTSGSTGRPKGVMVSHRNLVANQTAIIDGFGVRPDDVILSWLPMYHDMGLIGTALLPLFHGVPAVLLDTFAFVHDPMIWPIAIERFGATCSGGPNFAYQLIVDRYDADRLAGVDLSGWRIAFNGAEPVNARTLREFAARYAGHGFTGDALHPCYGLAEATLYVAGSEPGAGFRSGLFDRAALERGRLLPAVPETAHPVEFVASGTAALDTAIVIRGDDGRSLPDGQVGEICVRGPGVAHGYWGDPEATESTFRGRVIGRPGGWLRTGDLGAVHDGRLYPVGRSKDLIIVAGRNFHPYDVENAGSRASRLLRAGAAAAFQPDPDDRAVVLVVEVTREAVAGLRTDGPKARRLVEAVRRAVATECDLHLSEVVLLFPGSLPKTSSGKIRRAECRKRHHEGALRPIRRPAVTTEAAPDTPDTLDATLRRLAATHLGYELTEQDRGRPLAALGLDSLKLVAVKNGVERHLNRPVDARLFYGDRSLAEIAERIAALPPHLAPEPSGTGAGPGAHPAADGQVQLAFYDELHPEDTANILTTAVRIGRRLDATEIRAAVAGAVGRHPALRTVLGALGSGTQVVREKPDLELEVLDQDRADHRAARDLLSGVAFRRFALTTGPLVRFAAVRAPDSTTLLLACHHVIADYWSLRIVMSEILADLLGGEREPGTPATAIEWATATAAGTRQQLDDLTRRWYPLRNLLLFPAAPVRRRRNPAGVIDFDIDSKTTLRLYDHCRSHGYTPFTGLAAAYLRALHRESGHDEIVIGTPHHGRTDWRYAGTVGYLVDMLPLYGDLRDGDEIGDLTRRTWRELHTALETAHVPLARLIKELSPERHGQHPLFQATLTFQQSADGRLDDGFAIPSSGCRQTYHGVELTAVDLPPRDTAFAVSLYGARHGDRLVFRLQYQRDLVGPDVADRVCEQFRAGLRELTAPTLDGSSGGL
ncbi:AMP-binding protein [Actinoplanes sp. NPDC049802]|uniref:AMP-binding protein n=1 Tax=Actinoplanes sp. NPDC049802 TaxID=3154742 RepID=UPI0033EA07A4